MLGGPKMNEDDEKMVVIETVYVQREEERTEIIPQPSGTFSEKLYKIMRSIPSDRKIKITVVM